MKIQSYKKDLDYSYTLGVFPTLEMLKYKSKDVELIIYSAKAKESKGFLSLVDFSSKYNIPLVLDEKNVEKLSNKDNTYVIGIFKKFIDPIFENTNHLLLYEPKDIGNVGMIFRSAVGFGIKDIVILSESVDWFHPKVIRASMGAIFQCRISFFKNFDNYKLKYDRKIYSLDIKGKESLNKVIFKSPFSLIFGTEGDGLPDNILENTTGLIIPFESNKIESLNLANSVSITLYQIYINGRN